MEGKRVKVERTSVDATPEVLNITNAEVKSGANSCSIANKERGDGDDGEYELHV